MDTSYSADVSQASDVEEAATEKTLQDDQQEYEDPRDSKYLHLYPISSYRFQRYLHIDPI